VQTIVARLPPQRSTLYHKVLEDGRLADESTRALLLRMKLISNGVIVKPSSADDGVNKDPQSTVATAAINALEA
jgi:hypothetical protein